MERICPITMAPIEVAGILCSGNIFEYDAIKHWLQDHNRDPVTNLWLPTTFVVKWKNLDTVDEKAVDLRNSTKGWYKGIYFEDKIPYYVQRLKELKDLREQAYASPEWEPFEQAMHQTEALNGITQQAWLNRSFITEGRPPNTGTNAQFLRLKDRVYRKLSCKSGSFDLCELEQCTFIDCSFSECTFLGTTFKSVIFIHCNFIGDRFSLYDATGTISLTDCSFERLNWTPIKKQIDIVDALTRERHFKGSIQFLNKKS
jgi:hypothetical protein